MLHACIECRRRQPTAAPLRAVEDPRDTQLPTLTQPTQMNLDRVTTGRDVPHEINVVIEIPMNSEPIKYELDKQTGAMFVDRFVSTATHYPCNYGYIPHTLADDGDPADVLVVTPFPVMPGVVVRCRPVGMLAMTDEAGGDTKLLAVAVSG